MPKRLTTTPASAYRQKETLRYIMPAIEATYSDTKNRNQSISLLRKSFFILGLDVKVRSIRTRQLDRLVSVLRGRGLNNKTINRYLAPVSKALRWAVERDIILGVPKIPRLKEGPGRDTVLSYSDELRLLSWFEQSSLPDMAVITKTLLATGFRATELLTRSSKDLDSDGWLHLRIGETKNDDARAVWLPPELAHEFRLTLARGLPSYRIVWRWFLKAGKAISLPGISAHVLRHTTATRLNAKGVPTATIKEYMGHRSMITTLKYVKVRKDNIRAAGEVLREGPRMT